MEQAFALPRKKREKHKTKERMNTALSEAPSKGTPVGRRLPGLKGSRAERKVEARRQPLANVLQLSGIHVFPDDEVEAYMKKRLDALRNPSLKSYNTGIKIRSCSVVAFLTLYFIAVVMNFAKINGWMDWVIFSASVVLATHISCAIRFLGDQSPPQPRHQAAWKTLSFTDYLRSQSAVPEAIKTTAAVLTSRLPGVELEVDYLYEDPFLRASYVHPDTGIIEKACVGFWDENGFVH